MKRILLIFGLILSFAAANAQAQAEPTQQEQRAHTQAMKMQKMLTLTPEQTPQVEAVILKNIKAKEAVTQNASKPAEEQQKELDALKVQKDNELATIFTSEQLATYKLKKQQMEARQNMGGH